ncbi:MAG: hypothetical protein RLZZ353_361 [Actinomycetota bacterium]
MTLHDRIDADTTDAMRARDRGRLDALRLLRAALTNRLVADGVPPTARLDDAAVMAVVASEVKRRREAAQAFRDGGREESAAKEEAEAEVYAAYLPAQLDDAELRDVVAATVARLGATGPRDAGPVIREVLAETAGRADGGRVATLVRDALAGA